MQSKSFVKFHTSFHSMRLYVPVCVLLHSSGTGSAGWHLDIRGQAELRKAIDDPRDPILLPVGRVLRKPRLCVVAGVVALAAGEDAKYA